jgi:hypothetical protein
MVRDYTSSTLPPPTTHEVTPLRAIVGTCPPQRSRCCGMRELISLHHISLRR